MELSEIYKLYPVPECPGWFVQRYRSMENGLYRYQVWKGLRVMGRTKNYMTLEEALRQAVNFTKEHG